MPSNSEQNKTVLTIAGFDPSSGAGVTADLMVFAAHGLFGTSCITALTVQNTLGVFATQAVATDTITSTLDHLYADLPPVGVKIGMLATAEITRAVAAFLTRIRSQNPITVVLDPVLKSSSDRYLLDHNAIATLRDELLPVVDWITPNRDELSTLTNQQLTQNEDFTAAAEELRQNNPDLNIVVTGGDQDPPIDILLQPQYLPQIVTGGHIQTASTHGTGCAFSSALLSRLLHGDHSLQATQNAKTYVAEAMRTATAIGAGRGPLNLIWPLRQQYELNQLF